jgi:integrase
MASVQARSGKWQLRVAHKLLPKPFFDTFHDEAEARAYGVQLESLLDRGIVPVELLESGKPNDNPLLLRLIEDSLSDASIAPSDRATLELLGRELGAVRLLSVTALWADAWVVRLKLTQHLAPGTIRKRVESLARVLDHHWRLRAGLVPANPLRMMPRGYSQATAREAAELGAKHLAVKRDVQRDRRLAPDELVRIRAALAGERRADRERPLAVDPAFTLLFELIANSGLRLSEAYGLRAEQVDVSRWVLRLLGSKGHRGAAKPRVVPLVPALREPLAARCRDRVGLAFPFWDGTLEDKVRATRRLTGRFATLFDFAQVPDCTEHDLRHEATCRWVEMRDPAGRWVLSEIEVCKIMGWSDFKMMLRYASLRGEDLSARLG